MELTLLPQASQFRFQPKPIKIGLASPSILLVEENPESQQAHSHLLRLLSCKVDLATSGHEAIALSLQHTYDLVLLDTHLPDLCGFEVSRIIKTHRHPTHTPIIALTLSLQAPHSLHIDEWVPKPLTPEKLISVLTRWID